jgi:hypothetical protein
MFHILPLVKTIFHLAFGFLPLALVCDDFDETVGD